MSNRLQIVSGAYDHLIDAERDALSRSGRKVGKIELIKALRGATDLDLRDANLAVQGYLARQGGLSPPRGSLADRPTGWIDDLLDAERASASSQERPVNKILLIKALRGASGLDLRDAKLAVEDYLRRRGGEGLPSGSNGWLPAILLLILTALGVLYLATR